MMMMGSRRNNARQHHRPGYETAHAEDRRRPILLQIIDGPANRRRQLLQRPKSLIKSSALQTTHLNPLDRESGGRDQLRLETALRPDEHRSMTVLLEHTSHRQSRSDMTSRVAARHDEVGRLLHPECSPTLSRMPRQVSVLNRELPPELIIGRGIPFVGAMSSTTLMLMKA